MDPVSTACSVAKIIGSCLSTGAQGADGGNGGAGGGMGFAPQAHSTVEIGEVTCCSPVTFKKKNKVGNTSVKNRSRSNSTTQTPEHLKRVSKVFADSLSDIESVQEIPTRRPKIEIKVNDEQVLDVEELSDSKKLSLIGRLSASFRRASISDSGSPKGSPKASPSSSKRNSVVFSPETLRAERRKSVVILERLEERLKKEMDQLMKEEEQQAEYEAEMEAKKAAELTDSDTETEAELSE